MPSPLTDAVLRLVAELPWLPDTLRLALEVSEVWVEVQVDDPTPTLRDGGRTARGTMALRDAYRLSRKQWLLLGAAGAGKSTLLRKLAQELAAAGQVPVWLHADDLIGATSLLTAVAARYNLDDEADAARRAGRLVLLVDGLDESRDRTGAQRGLDAVVATLAGCPVIVASRDVGRVELSGFGRLVVQPLAPDQARLLLTRLGADPAVYGVLQRHARGWADNPTLLTLAALVAGKDGAAAIPARRADLYARAAEVIMGREYEAGRAQPLTVAERTALEDAVLALHGGDGFTRTELQECLRRRGDSVDAVGAFLRCGLIHEPLVRPSRGLLDRPPPPVLVFPHRTLAEWLGACALDRANLDDVLGRAVADPPRWAELLALAVSRRCAEEPAAGVALFDRINTRGCPPLSFRVVAEAEGLPASSVMSVLGVDGSRKAWEERSKVLRRLPELVGDPAVAVDVYLAFARTTRHGADLWWVCWGLEQIVDGEAGVLARAALDRVFAHIPEADRQRALALMDPWWRTIPAGESWLGSEVLEAGRWDDEGPQRRLRLAEPFEMLGVPVTQGMYRCFDRDHVADDDSFGGALAVPNPDELPVYRVSWYEAHAFARWLGLALPTEAAWEYACRGGTDTPFWSGRMEADLAAVGWYAGNANHPMPVAHPPTSRAHPFGLHDMHGNAQEWCADAWSDGHAKRPAVVDLGQEPFDAAPDAGRVIRGGSVGDSARFARSAFRFGGLPRNRDLNLGFRLVRPPRPPP